MGGLFELVGSKKDGAIVRSLDDKSTKFVSSRIHNFSHLESIEVYTSRENVNLVEILSAMDNAGEGLPSEKDAAAIKAYFEKVYPDMDFERVYASDMKKMIKWYSALKSNHVDLKLSAADEAEDQIAEPQANEEEITAPADIDEGSNEKTFEVVETEKAEPYASGATSAEADETVVSETDKDAGGNEPVPDITNNDPVPVAEEAPRKKAGAKKK